MVRAAACVCDMPSVATSDKSADMKSTFVPRAPVAQKVLVHGLHVPTDTHYMHRSRAQRPGDRTATALDAAADAAPGGRAPVAEPPVAHAVRLVKVPQPAEDAQEPRRPPHDGGRRGVVQPTPGADATRRGRGAIGEAVGRRARADLNEDGVGRLCPARGRRGARGSVRRVRGGRAGIRLGQR